MLKRGHRNSGLGFWTIGQAVRSNISPKKKEKKNQIHFKRGWRLFIPVIVYLIMTKRRFNYTKTPISVTVFQNFRIFFIFWKRILIGILGRKFGKIIVEEQGEITQNFVQKLRLLSSKRGKKAQETCNVANRDTRFGSSVVDKRSRASCACHSLTPRQSDKK